MNLKCWIPAFLLAGCGIQIGGEEWGGKVCLTGSPEPIGASAQPSGWDEPVSTIIGEATLPATGVLRPPIVGASPWDSGGVAGAEKGVPLSFTLRVEPTELTRVRRQPHLGAPFQSCPDQVLAPGQISIHSELVSIDAPVTVVFEPSSAHIEEELPPERGRTPETTPMAVPSFVQEFRYDRTWLGLTGTLSSGRWRGEIGWHGEDEPDPELPDEPPAGESAPIGVYETSAPSP